MANVLTNEDVIVKADVISNEDVMVKADVLVGLQRGDEGKGKITNYLSKKNDYDCFVRYNGGPNAGHTIYINNKPIVLHQVPCGILQNKPCLISSHCVIDIVKLNKELEILRKLECDVDNNLFIAYNAHIITEESIKEDKQNNKIGTTGSGIGQTYSKKALRTGHRICEYSHMYNFSLVEPFGFLSKFKHIFFEGAQGFDLDIDYGDYPYVTSSNCISGAIFLNGLSPKITPKIYGICKIYETYVGSKVFQPQQDTVLKYLQKLGEEFGATTGRMRQCNWLNLKQLITSCFINHVDILIINKCDILEKLQTFKLYDENNRLMTFSNFNDMKEYILLIFKKYYRKIEVIFSGNKDSL